MSRIRQSCSWKLNITQFSLEIIYFATCSGARKMPLFQNLVLLKELSLCKLEITCIIYIENICKVKETENEMFSHKTSHRWATLDL